MFGVTRPGSRSEEVKLKDVVLRMPHPSISGVWRTSSSTVLITTWYRHELGGGCHGAADEQVSNLGPSKHQHALQQEQEMDPLQQQQLHVKDTVPLVAAYEECERLPRSSHTSLQMHQKCCVGHGGPGPVKKTDQLLFSAWGLVTEVDCRREEIIWEVHHAQELAVEGNRTKQQCFWAGVCSHTEQCCIGEQHKVLSGLLEEKEVWPSLLRLLTPRPCPR